MTREQAQLVRLLLMCLAWAIGQTLTIGLASGMVGTIIPAALAVGVYVITDDLGRPRFGGGGGGGGGAPKYWRGRRIDDDRPDRGRWN